MDLPCVRGVCERSDVSIRRREGLPPAAGHLAGEERDLVQITENGLAFEVARILKLFADLGVASAAPLFRAARRIFFNCFLFER